MFSLLISNICNEEYTPEESSRPPYVLHFKEKIVYLQWRKNSRV